MFSKILLSFSLLLLFFSLTYSQNNKNAGILMGNVKTFKSQEPIIGATVALDSNVYETYTDIDGNFTITNIKPGSYRLNISYLLFETQIIDNIRIESGETETFEVEMKEWGKSEAENDIKTGNVKILVEGMVVTCKPTGIINNLCKQYGFKYEYTGCELIGVDTYNNTVYDYLDELNGKGWREEFEIKLKELCSK